MSFSLSTKLIWNGDKVKLAGKKTTVESVFEAGIVLEGQAVAFAPADTGRLRGSITTQTRDREHMTVVSNETESQDIISKPVQEMEAFVGTNVFYGPYQEYGTRKMNAQPFLRPTFDLYSGKAISVFKINGHTEFAEYL